RALQLLSQARAESRFRVQQQDSSSGCYRLEALQIGFNLGQLFSELLGLLFANHLVWRVHLALAMLHTGEACLYRVVFSLRDWIKFVIMAARTTDGKTEKRAAGRADHIVEFIRTLRRGQHRVRTFYL